MNNFNSETSSHKLLDLMLRLKNKTIKNMLVKLLFRMNHGFCILQEDWQNLMILDACRYDTFEKLVIKTKLKGSLETRVSRGTETVSFLRENFHRRMIDDIVYITANPQVSKEMAGRFYSIVPVWKYAWNKQFNTVLPSSMYGYVRIAQEKYPNKRYIIHYLQPHRPFIGLQTRFTSRSRPVIPLQFFAWGSFKEKGKNLLYTFSKDDLFKMYEHNLLLVLTELEDLAKILKGKTVITSDHGEAFGEFIHPLIPIRVFGHPARTRIPALTLVPWFVLETDSSDYPIPELKENEAIPQTQMAECEYDLITSRLKDLGYE